MTYKTSKENFAKILIECRDYTKEEAEGVANEYRNDFGAYLSDIGGDKEALESAKVFFSRMK